MKKSCSGSGICSPARLRYFLPTWILGRELADNGRSWEILTERARQEGYQGLEIHDRRLRRLSDPEAEQIIARIRTAGLTVVLGLDTDFTAPGEEKRSAEINRTLRRLQWAGGLGITLTRITTGGQKLSLAGLIRILQPVSPTVSRGVENFFTRPPVAQVVRKLRRGEAHQAPAGVIERVIQALRIVSEAAEKTGLLLVLENHWGVSGDWRNLAAIMKAVSSPALGICLDWGNFPTRGEVLPGIRGLLPWTRHQHAKSYGFDFPENNSPLPFGEIVRQVQQAGYEGALTLEYEGPGDPWLGCRRTREVIEKLYLAASD